MQWYHWLNTAIGLYIICGVILALIASRKQEGTIHSVTVLEFIGIIFIGPFLLVCFYTLSGMDWFNWRL